MIEEYIHKPDGTLEPKDPYAIFLKEGTRVRIIKANYDIGIGVDEVGATGKILASDAESNIASVKKDIPYVKKNLPPRIYAHYYEDYTDQLYCYPDMLEVVG